MPKKKQCPICGCTGAGLPNHLTLDEMNIIIKRFRLPMKIFGEIAAPSSIYSVISGVYQNERIHSEMEKYLIEQLQIAYMRSWKESQRVTQQK